MMEHFDPWRNIIVNNFCYVIHRLHECDLLILSCSNYATEVEIKVSPGDLRADSKKKHGHVSDFIRRFYFAVPEELEELALELIPERAGLFVVEKRVNSRSKFYCTVRLSRQCKNNTKAKKWTDAEKYKLMLNGTRRILNSKRKIKSLIMSEGE